jgi:hypothetical protein
MSDPPSGAAGERQKRGIRRAALRARPRQEKETNNEAGSMAAKMSTRERNERCSERHGSQSDDNGKDQATHRVARLARRRRLNDASETAQRSGGQDADEVTKPAMQQEARCAGERDERSRVCTAGGVEGESTIVGIR